MPNGRTLPLLTLVLVALAAGHTMPATAAAETRSFAADADAPVASARPWGKFGRHRRLVVERSRGTTRMSYVKFDVSLPEGAVVTGARLRIYAVASHRSPTSLSRAGSRWTEAGVNWRTRPAAAGGVLSVDNAKARGWRTFRLGAVEPGVQSFVLRAGARTVSRYGSRESAHGPRLVVTYAPQPEPAGCPVARPQASWRAPRSGPLTDAQAAACVSRSGENRPGNVEQNAKAPTSVELDAFRTARDAYGRTPAEYNENFAFVTGAAALYGLRSSDDMIEWAAYKWGIPEDLVRGQMIMESGWSMLQTGDRRDWATPVAQHYPALAVIDGDSVWESLGIAQIRWRHTVPWNPGVEPLRWQSTGFALDYSQALIRYYYDGLCDWCGEGYVAGDADGAYRAYVSGSWSEGQWYADGVRGNAASKPWQPIPPE